MVSSASFKVKGGKIVGSLFASIVLPAPGGPIKIALFDIMGRLVYYKEKMAVDNTLTIDNLSFAQGEYFVKLTAKNYNYSTTLLKSK